MGTNYYLYTGRRKSGLHIGKSSYGWRFNMHFIPGVCESLDDWLNLMSQTGKHIRNEYDDPVTFGEMAKIILCRGIKFPGHPYCTGRTDFHARNHDRYTDWDPINCLCRYKVERSDHSTRCVQSLEGVTYDMTVGEYL